MRHGPFAHSADDGRHELPWRPQVDLQAELQSLRRHGLEGHVPVDRRVVHEDVDRTQCGLGAGNEIGAITVRVTQICGQHQTLPAESGDASTRRFEPFHCAGGDGHLGALGGKTNRDSGSRSALARAGHQRDLPRAQTL